MYSTIESLLALVPESTIIKLSNDESGATEIDIANVEAAIVQADRVIDGYVGVQRQVPLDPVPGLIGNISANLAVYNLYRRRNQVPEIWQEQYKADMAVLAKIGTGHIPLGVAGPGTAEYEPPAQALTHSSRKTFGGSGGLLEGY